MRPGTYIRTPETNLKSRLSAQKRRATQETKDKIGAAMKGKTAGPKHYRWKGGQKVGDVIYTKAEYAEWRKKVFQRDNFTCVICNVKGKRFHADHILPKCLYPERMFDLDNGRTLCVPCHKLTPTYGINKEYMTMKINNTQLC